MPQLKLSVGSKTWTISRNAYILEPDVQVLTRGSEGADMLMIFYFCLIICKQLCQAHTNGSPNDEKKHGMALTTTISDCLSLISCHLTTLMSTTLTMAKTVVITHTWQFVVLLSTHALSHLSICCNHSTRLQRDASHFHPVTDLATVPDICISCHHSTRLVLSVYTFSCYRHCAIMFVPRNGTCHCSFCSVSAPPDPT